LDKPVGISSQRALSIAKRQLKVRKAGHSGTLDPLASGLLIVAVGSWSRLLAFVLGAPKVYRGVVRCGLRTDSLDITGAVQGFRPVPAGVDAAVVDHQLQSFKGPIQQLPPVFSALKVNGVRAYELARAGSEVRLEQRSVVIHDIELLGLARSGPFLDVEVRIACSSGTYIRSIARDLGELLGTGATLLALRREAIGEVTVDAANDPTTIVREDRLGLSAVFPTFGRYEIAEDILRMARHGHALVLPRELAAFEQVLVLAAGPEPEYQRLVGVYRNEADRLVPLRVIPEEVTQ
jgi:tRNA pseudouridine55 synthase